MFLAGPVEFSPAETLLLYVLIFGVPLLLGASVIAAVYLIVRKLKRGRDEERAESAAAEDEPEGR